MARQQVGMAHYICGLNMQVADKDCAILVNTSKHLRHIILYDDFFFQFKKTLKLICHVEFIF